MPRLPTLRLVVKVTAPFCYTSDKAIPWNYMSQAVIQEPQTATKQNQETFVNDIARTEGMTRSGRCYASVNSEAKERENSTENGGIKIATPKRKDKEPINKSVTEVEANEFLKFIKNSEYNIVE